MIVALTGGSGFVGRAVRAHLVGRGWTVRHLSRAADAVSSTSEPDLVQGDLADERSLEPLVDGVDAIVHAAGLVRSRDRDALWAANVEGTINLAKVAHEVPRFVYVSTAGIYGRPGGTVTERSPLDPPNAYEKSKAAAESALRQLRPVGAVVVRPTNVIGVGHPSDPLARFLKAVRTGRVWASPSAWTNYVAVRDLASIIGALLEDQAPPEEIVVNDGCSVLDLASRSARLLGVPDHHHAVPAWVGRAAEPTVRALARHIEPAGRARALLDTTRIETVHHDWLQNKCQASLEPTLRELIDDYRARGLL